MALAKSPAYVLEGSDSCSDSRTRPARLRAGSRAASSSYTATVYTNTSNHLILINIDTALSILYYFTNSKTLTVNSLDYTWVL